MLSLLSYLVMPLHSEWKRLLLGGSRLPSEQLKPSLLLLHVPSSSSPFTMGLPHPLNHLTTLPLRLARQTLACTCACQCVHKKRKFANTHWTDWGVAAVLLCCTSVDKQRLSVRAWLRRRQRPELLSPQSLCCVCVSVFESILSRNVLKPFLNVSNPKPETNSRTDAEGLRLSTFA